MSLNSKIEKLKEGLGCEILLVTRPQYMAAFPDRVEHQGCGMWGKLEPKGTPETIHYNEVSDVVISKVGFSHFTIKKSGRDEDDMSMVFEKKYNEVAVKLREYILDKAKASKSSGTSQVSGASVADELKKFSDLKDQGILSEEEFDAKKKELLGL